MSHLSFSFLQPVVGTLVKFPNQHLFQSKSYFSISNLWATIEILISTQLSFKSTFNNIFSINHWLLKPWHFGKFCHWPCFVHLIMPHVWSNGKFPIFLFLSGTLAVKAMAFWEILLFSHQNLLFLNHVKISLIIQYHHHMIYTLANIKWVS